MEFLIFNFFVFIVELLYEKLTQGNDTQRNNPHNANCDNLNEEICKWDEKTMSVFLYVYLSVFICE